ncbi:hypothetical protein SLEP1_g36146 [Rubroshorea leprosula]|uniref:Uncharacterized protein n=1 Tax=Rubroshorea leprosula TaxID=152421 RepID=A0AAV5KR38_9ROSI|nr:hypothetical protein SLEP1_g36146 [Rubroshorea leprosula]
MKRQRDEENAIVRGGESEGRIAAMATAVPQKKNKSAVEISKVDGKEETDSSSMKKENVKWWEECWPWMNGMADEQMWWGYVWSPFWDFDFVDKAYDNPHQLGDIVWDDDIWNLKRTILK